MAMRNRNFIDRVRNHGLDVRAYFIVQRYDNDLIPILCVIVSTIAADSNINIIA